MGAQYLLSLRKRPTAIACYNDNMAIGVYSALYAARLTIPRDISVAGFDDISVAAYLVPPLTTLRQLKHELGADAASMILHLLETRSESGSFSGPQKIGLRGELVIRSSTASPCPT